MADMKFTPGPWEAEPIHADAYPYHIGSYDIVSRSKSMSATVATVAARMSETAKADARLIAAAPGLYEALDLSISALKAVRDVLGTYGGGTMRTNDAVIAKAEAALAKAVPHE